MKKSNLQNQCKHPKQGAPFLLPLILIGCRPLYSDGNFSGYSHILHRSLFLHDLSEGDYFQFGGVNHFTRPPGFNSCSRSWSKPMVFRGMSLQISNHWSKSRKRHHFNLLYLSRTHASLGAQPFVMKYLPLTMIILSLCLQLSAYLTPPIRAKRSSSVQCIPAKQFILKFKTTTLLRQRNLNPI